MMDKESITNDIDSDEIILGNKLRLLRKSRGYTIDDVAGQLYLDSRLIAALESGDYSKIQSLIYVKGYIRNYIKLFDASSEFELTILDDQENQNQNLNIIPGSIMYKKKNIFINVVNTKYIFFVVLILVITGLYVVELQFNLINKVKKIINNSDNVSVDKKQSFNNNLLDNKLNIDNEKVDTVTVLKALKVTKQLNLNELDLIDLYFELGSWAQIKDATGTKLISRFVKSGKRMNLMGKLPFTVILGNSPSVKIKVNGNNFDQSKYNSKEIAHFVINKNNMNLQQEVHNAKNN
jgi:cytoskeleton protein RodZ